MTAVKVEEYDDATPEGRAATDAAMRALMMLSLRRQITIESSASLFLHVISRFCYSAEPRAAARLFAAYAGLAEAFGDAQAGAIDKSALSARIDHINAEVVAAMQAIVTAAPEQPRIAGRDVAEHAICDAVETIAQALGTAAVIAKFAVVDILGRGLAGQAPVAMTRAFEAWAAIARSGGVGSDEAHAEVMDLSVAVATELSAQQVKH